MSSFAMDYNFSIYATSLTLESLDLLPCYVLPAFIFGILTYGVILLFNFIILLTIALNRKLHKPMYILLFNLPVNDLMGATTFFPQLVSSILLQTRTITYSACFIQALLVHLYGVGSLVILSAMAYDRYVAICFPLKYNSLMSSSNLLKIIIIMWMIDCILIGFLLALNYRKEICSTKIVDIFCNNPSLMRLICGDIKLNNYFGMFTIVFVQGLSLMIVLFTYIQILFTCISRRQSDAKSKAIQTCGTHLMVFLCFEFNILFTLIAHRFENSSPNLRKAFGASVMIFPPILNPLIYGLKTKEIRQNIFYFFHKTFWTKKL
uniref:Olfactory receptor n=2 Tax=Electrophorus electricus TaxID=8005 RepID=A0A4W4DUP2_ELEEL